MLNNWALRQDADITREASEALTRTVLAPTDSVHAKVHDQVVTLTGTVAWHYQREALRHAVAALPGVRNVFNDITIQPHLAISPVEAKAKIAAALRRNAELDAHQIHIEIDWGTITLTGSAPDWAEQRQASYAGWISPGVTHVNNDLRVAYWTGPVHNSRSVVTANPLVRRDRPHQSRLGSINLPTEEHDESINNKHRTVEQQSGKASGTTTTAETMKVGADALAARVKGLVHEGNVRRIVVKNSDGHTVIEIPVTAGVVATVAAPVLAAVAAIAALANHWEIEIHRAAAR